MVAPMNRSPARERSIGELFGELAAETGLLVRQEVKLATREMSDKAKQALRRGVTVAAGAVLGFVSLLAIVAGLILWLGTIMPLWGAALAVGAGLGLVAFVVAGAGLRALTQMDLKPQQTLLSIEETKAWVHEQVR